MVKLFADSMVVFCVLNFDYLAKNIFTCFVKRMQIANFQTPQNLSFQANLNSRKLKFKSADFWVNIRGYGKNRIWAQSVKNTADTAVNLIRKDTSCENVLRFITAGITKANKLTFDLTKREHTGILRAGRVGWKSGSSWDKYDILATDYSLKNSAYKSYELRLDKRIDNPVGKPYPYINLTRPMRGSDTNFLRHGDKNGVNAALDMVVELYKNHIAKYTKIDVQPEHLKDINNNVAEIRWILAHSTPWERGSDSIANVFIRAIYKALGIKATPLAKGVSLDLEAYCTELDRYKKKFPTYFEKPPEVVL